MQQQGLSTRTIEPEEALAQLRVYSSQKKKRESDRAHKELKQWAPRRQQILARQEKFDTNKRTFIDYVSRDQPKMVSDRVNNYLQRRRIEVPEPVELPSPCLSLQNNEISQQWFFGKQRTKDIEQLKRESPNYKDYFEDLLQNKSSTTLIDEQNKVLRGMSLSTPVSQITLDSSISHVGWLKGAKRVSSSASYQTKSNKHLKTTNSLFRKYLTQRPTFSAPTFMTAENNMKLTYNPPPPENFYNVDNGRYEEPETPLAFKLGDGSVGRLQMCDSDMLKLPVSKGGLYNELSSKSDKISPTFSSDRLYKLFKMDSRK